VEFAVDCGMAKPQIQAEPKPPFPDTKLAKPGIEAELEPRPKGSAIQAGGQAFTKALAKQLASRGIRVNCVAPGPVWTPLNAADEGNPPEKVKTFGETRATSPAKSWR
jgi:NAD(P)-dependent dehydrogenase (short-subunit alcohol dehydrogenase family)